MSDTILFYLTKLSTVREDDTVYGFCHAMSPVIFTPALKLSPSGVFTITMRCQILHGSRTNKLLAHCPRVMRMESAPHTCECSTTSNTKFVPTGVFLASDLEILVRGTPLRAAFQELAMPQCGELTQRANCLRRSQAIPIVEFEHWLRQHGGGASVFAKFKGKKDASEDQPSPA